MKKKILMAMMLCVCVFGLTGCNKQEENARTLEVAIKTEQKSDFEEFRLDFIGYSEDLFTDIDIIGNEIIITSQNPEYDSLKENKDSHDIFIITMENSIGDPEVFDYNHFIDMFNSLANDYDGDTIVKVKFITTSGDVLYSVSYDAEGKI